MAFYCFIGENGTGSSKVVCGDNNNCTDDCVALVEHETNGKKRVQRQGRGRRLRYDDHIIPFSWLGISI